MLVPPVGHGKKWLCALTAANDDLALATNINTTGYAPTSAKAFCAAGVDLSLGVGLVFQNHLAKFLLLAMTRYYTNQKKRHTPNLKTYI